MEPMPAFLQRVPIIKQLLRAILLPTLCYTDHAPQIPQRIQKVDPPGGSAIYIMGVLEFYLLDPPVGLGLQGSSSPYGTERDGCRLQLFGSDAFQELQGLARVIVRLWHMDGLQSKL